MDTVSIYKPLGENEIRLLRIHPGPETADLSASLEHHNLDSSEHLYTTISYPWGPPEDPHFPCHVHGATFSLRKNATQILKILRSTKNDVLVWLDRLSINQENKPEKSAQIRLMYKVYRLAKSTVIWLGEADESTQLIQNYARSLDTEKILREQVSATLYNANEKSFILDELAGNDDMIPILNGIATLFCAVWFSRVWIRSEGAVSGEVYALRGPYHFTWNQLTTLAYLFQPRTTMNWPDWSTIRFDKVEPTLKTILAIDLYRVREAGIKANESNLRANHLFEHIVQARSSLTEKPHDKVYAMSSMASDVYRSANETFLRPNYSLAWQEVYANAAKFFFTDYLQAFKVLEQAGVIYQGVNSDLPSWVPDWRYPALTQIPVANEWQAGGDTAKVKTKVNLLTKKEKQRLLSYRGPLSIAPLLAPLDRERKELDKKRAYLEAEGTHMKPETLESESKNLTMQEVWLRYRESAAKAALVLDISVSMQDQIVYLAPRSTWIYDAWFCDHRAEILEIDNQNLEFLRSTGKEEYITSETLVQAYSATLIFMQDVDGNLATTELISSAEEWRAWLSSSDQAASPPPPYHSSIENAFTFRDYTFAYTATGYMALVPIITQPDDHIVIIQGYRMPFVLRPVLGDWYQLVGTCYVHGMMRMDAGTLIEEFNVKYEDGMGVAKRPQGDVRANGLKLEAGRYVEILSTLGHRTVKLI